ncbi:MAG: GGDEF domain-containing protein [Roseburia sp.]|nr:GGDEF domain-containing protein [Roseburia sp.]MCM1242336.1 GGDEF domain-containing protein [Roseburia sp.]
MLLKTSAVCFMFILYMTGFYYRKPHIPIRSTRIFRTLIGVTFINTLFDMITLYTVNHRDTVPEQVNLAAHIVYLLSILGFIYILFLYMRSYLAVRLQFSTFVKGLQFLPFAISTIGILILPIIYVHGETTDYSLGPKAYALYFGVVIYLLLILYYCLRYWDILDGEKRMAIILAVPIFVVVSLIQMFIPETLLVVVASTLIMLGLILSNENTEKYVDEKTALFNQYSFETVLEEFDFEKQKMRIALLCFCKTESNHDWKQDVLILRDIHKELRQYRVSGYRVCENGVAFICVSEEKAQMMLEEIKDFIEIRYGKENVSIETKLLLPEEVDSKYGCMQNVIAFCTEAGRNFAYVDYLTHIYNRNALERDLAKVKEGDDGYYIIADLNDLKVVNDTIGHSAGDALLQGFAGLLENTAGEDGRAYRQGGDEFAVLYRQDARQFINKLAENCKIYNRSSNIPLSYAIGYCALNDADYMDAADQMMYADKKKIKERRKNGN